MNSAEIVRLIEWLKAHDYNAHDIVNCIEYVVDKNSHNDKE